MLHPGETLDLKNGNARHLGHNEMGPNIPSEARESMAHWTLPEPSKSKGLRKHFLSHGNPQRLLMFHENLFALERGHHWKHG